MAYQPIVGPGAASGKAGTEYDQAIGLERIEYLARTHGINIFNNEPLKITSFGTLEAPVLVEAFGSERIVGCKGFLMTLNIRIS